MGLLGILLGLALLIGLAYRGWSVLLLAPAAAMVAALLSREPLLAHWTQTFMVAAGGFVAQFFPLFLLGALFGKLMEDSGSVAAIARWFTERLGVRRAVLAVVLAGALVTYGGVSLFVAIFVIVPMGQALFASAGIPNRLLPAAVALGSMTFTMSAMPGTPAIQNAIPMPFFGTTAFAAPGLGLIASAIMLGFGLWWLARAERAARSAGETALAAPLQTPALDQGLVRERSVASREFDPAETGRGHRHDRQPPLAVAVAPLAVVVLVNLTMSLLVLPRLDTAFLAEPRWGGVTLAAVAGVWSVIVALLAAIVTLLLLNRGRLPDLRATMDAGANASVLPILSVASLVGFGAVVAALPAFAVVRDAVLGVGNNPLVTLAIATNTLAALTGSASGGLTIALDALGADLLKMAATEGIDPALMHRVAVIGAGTLDSLPHNGAVVTLLALCGATHRESYRDIVVACIVGPIIALVVVIGLGTRFGSF
ncbi:GntP family permease [Rivibacter subsaxonicus]|uniref:H+/gluconate symporter-like permease n=1 Tax=Rivibacter subsaxonicus TaxID=457575 RepID=A0A4Q7VD25_9BURK|nr:GntP family permease [Rivibacter subsaxonicus]RZT93754.1 H+/gluconate symporter-like permease [Rivibacter subsaxonicus]